MPDRVVIVQGRRGWGCGTTFVAIILVGLAIVYWPVTVGVLGALLVGLIVARLVIRSRKAPPPPSPPEQGGGGAPYSDRR
jgi:hypothetical protein